MSSFKRVKDKATGHEYTTRRPDPKKVDVLPGKPAVDVNGRPLPGKPNLAAPSRDKKKSGSEPSGADSKESTK